jgi:large subunit ribosomal protein L10
MKRAEKEALVTGLKDRITQSSTVYLTDFTGLSVKNMTDLRRRFRSAGIEFLVAKNTLALRALHEVSIDSLDDVLAGPTGFVFAGAEPVGAAKVLEDFRKETQNKPAVKAG